MCHFHLGRRATAPINIMKLKYFRFSLKLIKLCIITPLTMTAMCWLKNTFWKSILIRIIGNTKLCSIQFQIWLNELIDCDKSQKCIRVITYLAKNWFSWFYLENIYCWRFKNQHLKIKLYLQFVSQLKVCSPRKRTLCIYVNNCHFTAESFVILGKVEYTKSRMGLQAAKCVPTNSDKMEYF